MKNDCKQEEYFSMLKQYLEKYSQFYTEDELRIINDKFYKLKSIKKTPEFLMQIYARFNMLEDKENYYYGFAKMIGNKYGYDKNILEIGGGIVDSPFAYYYSKLITEHKGLGSITVYDPKLLEAKSSNLKLVKKEFTEFSDVSQYDLLVGILSCHATRDIINTAILKNKEFFIAMCGCTHFDIDELYMLPFLLIRPSYNKWVNIIYHLATMQKNKGFEVRQEKIKLKKHGFSFPYPVISSKSIPSHKDIKKY